MAGLAGILGKIDKDRLAAMMQLMLSAIKYGHAQSSGMYTDEKMAVTVAWAVQKGTYSDCMPMATRSGKTKTFFHGEHIHEINGCEDAIAKEYDVNGNNGEVLPYCYEKMGDDFYAYLNGFFHGVLIDGEKKEVSLFADRFGMQRLYIYQPEKNLIVFASEAKAILKAFPETRSFDKQGMADWLSTGCALGGRTLFNGIRVMDGGRLWRMREDGTLSTITYFTPDEWENQEVVSKDLFFSRLEECFHEIIPKYCKSQTPIGISTTGGLDTRMILAHLNTNAQKFRAYSFSGPYRDCLDALIGKKVAETCSLPHEIFNIDKTFFSDFENLANDVVFVSDGNQDMTGTANLYMSRLAREISPVRLTGNYGSEVLRRHRAFRPGNLLMPYLDDGVAGLMKQSEQTWNDASNGNKLSFAVFRQAPWYQYNRLSVEQSELVIRSPFMDKDLLRILYTAPDDAIRSSEISLKLIAAGSKKLAKIVTDRGVRYPQSIASPFLRAYYEWLFKMEYYANQGMPQKVAKIIGKRGSELMEKAFIGVNKYYHFRVWWKNELSKFVKDVALQNSSVSREYLRRDIYANALKAHLDGKENHAIAINAIVTLELCQRRLFNL